MKLENIEEVRILISQRNTLTDVVDKFARWKDGHFEFVEHCGLHPDKVNIAYFPDLEKKFIEIIYEEIKLIEQKLEKL